MGKLFLYLAAHPLIAIIGWVLCGKTSSRIPRIVMRTGVLAIVFSPTVTELPNGTQIPVSAITALYYDLPATPLPLVMIAAVWVTLILAAFTFNTDNQSSMQ